MQQCPSCGTDHKLGNGPALTPELVQALEFQHGFFGYGAYEAPIWTVSLEPGGAIAELGQWHAGWVGLERHELCDPYELHDGFAPWFDLQARVQSTWGPAIAFGLAARGMSEEQIFAANGRRVLEQQQKHWCRDKILATRNCASCIVNSVLA